MIATRKPNIFNKSNIKSASCVVSHFLNHLLDKVRPMAVTIMNIKTLSGIYIDRIKVK